MNNNIFWKRVMRPFRCTYVNCFNILRFFLLRSAQNWKVHFFRQFEDHNSGAKLENYINDPIFFMYFFCSTCLQHSFLNLKILFKLITMVHSGQWNTSIFSKIYWFGQLIILFQTVDTLMLLKIYVMFCLPAGAK